MSRSQLIALISVAIGSAAVCAAIAGIYLGRGAPTSTEGPLAPIAAVNSGGGAPTAAAGRSAAPPLDQLVDKLAARMRDAPNDGQGWALLARTYAQLKRNPEALEAFAHAARLLPNDPVLLADFATASAEQKGSWRGEPSRLAAAALAAGPNEPRALVAGGHAAFERPDYANALVLWQKAEPLIRDDPERRAAVHADIENVRALIAQGAKAGPTKTKPSSIAR
jgi:cytochrome c-type biogenesis protein CcmH